MANNAMLEVFGPLEAVQRAFLRLDIVAALEPTPLSLRARVGDEVVLYGYDSPERATTFILGADADDGGCGRLLYEALAKLLPYDLRLSSVDDEVLAERLSRAAAV